MRGKKSQVLVDRFLTDNVILKEVRWQLREQPWVDVIVAFHRERDRQTVKRYLSGIGATLSERETDFYLFARINEAQADRIDEDHATDAEHPLIYRVWYDKPVAIRASLEDSGQTINVTATRKLFERGGEKIHWAVIDSGIRWDHEWLTNNVVDGTRHDYTGEGLGDGIGHGTHVAGILARLAPKVTLHDYRVLDSKGEGPSSAIIMALYDIRELNFKAHRMAIHGVNLSLGGPVEVGSYGCGVTPICEEANRLMLSGVLVCVAAGNDGHKTLVTSQDNQISLFDSYLDLGISDPGNAEEVITVGSVHSTRPHTYGISFFSSKGPTGDGRRKPDLVAPGERILSASHTEANATQLLSGTSMATPHVSAALAVFLSVKPEFIGHAQRVKRILLDSCTDLHRDANFQGAGLLDILRAVQSV